MWLSLLAVFSALAAPVSLLAEEVRTGKLGGLCSVQTQLAGDPDSRGDAVLQSASHCEWCGSAALSMPPTLRSLPGAIGLSFDVASNAAPLPVGAPLGLPFGRGPPPV